MAFFARDGKVFSDWVEFQIVDHCNLSCRACNHLSPTFGRRFVAPADIRRDVSVLRKYFHAKSLYLLGGEPLLHPGMLEIAGIIRESGITDRVAVLTNGTVLPRLTNAVIDALDYVEVSVYPGQEPDAAELARVVEHCRAGGKSLLVHRISTFRDAYSELPGGSPGLVSRIYRTCHIAHAWGMLFVRDGQIHKCSRSHLLPLRFPHLAGGDRANGVRIRDEAGFFTELKDYLFDRKTREPLPACRQCLGTAGRVVPHRQQKRSEWAEPQNFPLAELVDEEYLAQREAHGFTGDNTMYAHDGLHVLNLKPEDHFPYLSRFERMEIAPNIYGHFPQLAEGGVC